METNYITDVRWTRANDTKRIKSGWREILS